MRKIFAILLTLTLALSLAACGEDESTSGGDNNTSGGGNSTTQQGGTSGAGQGNDNTNKSGVWSDSDQHEITFTTGFTRLDENATILLDENENEILADVEVTYSVWNPKTIVAKDMSESLQKPHPNNAKLTVTPQAPDDEFYFIPFKVTLKNVSDVSDLTMRIWLYIPSSTNGEIYIINEATGDANVMGNDYTSSIMKLQTADVNTTATYYGFAAIPIGNEEDMRKAKQLLHFGLSDTDETAGLGYENPEDDKPKLWTKKNGSAFAWLD